MRHALSLREIHLIGFVRLMPTASLRQFCDSTIDYDRPVRVRNQLALALKAESCGSHSRQALMITSLNERATEDLPRSLNTKQ